MLTISGSGRGLVQEEALLLQPKGLYLASWNFSILACLQLGTVSAPFTSPLLPTKVQNVRHGFQMSCPLRSHGELCQIAAAAVWPSQLWASCSVCRRRGQRG